MIRSFAALIGQLVAVCPSVKYGTLYLKNLEKEKWLALSKTNSFNTKMTIPKYL